MVANFAGKSSRRTDIHGHIKVPPRQHGWLAGAVAGRKGLCPRGPCRLSKVRSDGSVARLLWQPLRARGEAARGGPTYGRGHPARTPPSDHEWLVHESPSTPKRRSEGAGSPRPFGPTLRMDKQMGIQAESFHAHSPGYPQPQFPPASPARWWPLPPAPPVHTPLPGPFPPSRCNAEQAADLLQRQGPAPQAHMARWPSPQGNFDQPYGRGHPARTGRSKTWRRPTTL